MCARTLISIIFHLVLYVSNGDKLHIFMQVPDYLDYIKTPMDFSSMRAKVDGHEYRSLDDFHDDFELIVNNCITYNSKDTMFYKAALKLKEQVSHAFAMHIC